MDVKETDDGTLIHCDRPVTWFDCWCGGSLCFNYYCYKCGQENDYCDTREMKNARSS